MHIQPCIFLFISDVSLKVGFSTIMRHICIEMHTKAAVIGMEVYSMIFSQGFPQKSLKDIQKKKKKKETTSLLNK